RLFELVEAGECAVDGRRQFPCRCAAAAFAGCCPDGPEDRVVGMSDTVVIDRAADLLWNLFDTGQQIFDRLLGEILLALKSFVQVSDISRVMLAMVDTHGLFIDVR